MSRRAWALHVHVWHDQKAGMTLDFKLSLSMHPMSKVAARKLSNLGIEMPLPQILAQNYGGRLSARDGHQG